MKKYITSHAKFFEMYHQGAVNIAIHFLGFTLWGIGVGGRNWFLIIIAPLIFESGHFYNYVVGRRTKFDTLMIPVQLMTWLIFILLAWILLAI